MENYEEAFLNQTLVYEQAEERYTINNSPILSEEVMFILLNQSDEALVKFLQRIGILPVEINCLDCNERLTKTNFTENRTPYFRCPKRSCSRKRISVFKNTIFEGSKLPLKKVLHLLFWFSCRRPLSDAAETLDLNVKTVASFYAFFRSTLCAFLDRFSVQLGGPDVCVHLDETPITRRHNNTGSTSASNTVWVIGAVDVARKKCVLRFLPSHGHSDILPFVRNWIAPGTTVYTDCHRSYQILGSLGYNHRVVNHSIGFKSTEGYHTNHIEGIFGNMKRLMRSYSHQYKNVSTLNTILGEWMFRFCYDGWNRKTAFSKILFVLKQVRVNNLN